MATVEEAKAALDAMITQAADAHKVSANDVTAEAGGDKYTIDG